MAVQRRSSIDVTPVRTPGASHVPYTTAPQAYSDTINAWTQTFDATAIHPRSRFDEEQLTSAATVQDFASPCQARTDLLSNALHRSIAPVFPELNDTNEFFPLLANLTGRRSLWLLFSSCSSDIARTRLDGDLSDDERLLRASYRHHDDIIPTPLYSDNQIRSDIRTLLNSHAKKWRVDASVLIANLNRLFTILPRLTLKDFILKQQQQPYALSIDEWFIALEFYLQMDGS